MKKLIEYPNTIHTKLKKSAKKNGRTIMGEIREILIQWANK